MLNLTCGTYMSTCTLITCQVDNLLGGCGGESHLNIVPQVQANLNVVIIDGLWFGGRIPFPAAHGARHMGNHVWHVRLVQRLLVDKI